MSITERAFKKKITKNTELVRSRNIDIEDAPDTNIDYSSSTAGQRGYQYPLIPDANIPTGASSEGRFYYDVTNHVPKYDNGTDIITFAVGAAGSLNTSYDAGAIINIDASGGHLEFDLADSSTDKHVQIKNIVAGTIDVGLLFDTENASAACILTDAVKFTCSGAGSSIGTALNVSDAGITTGIDIGGTAIAGTNFNVSAAGAIVGVGLDYGSGGFVGTGDIAITTNKFTVTAASGNTLVAGTFDVTGNSALAGNLVVTGDLTVNGAWALGSQLTAGNGIDMDGSELIMDGDGNSSLHMETDDQLDINLGGADEYVFTTASLDLNANELIFDANGNTSITADTDDRFDFRIGGTDELQYSTAAFAFQVATTISTGATTLTLDPNTDVIVADTKGLIIGHTAQVTTNVAAECQVLGTASADSTLIIGQFPGAAATGPALDFVKSRGAMAANTIVVDDDILGLIDFHAGDGTDFVTRPASIQAEVDDGAGPAASDIGGALVFMTASGAGADDVAEKLRINAAGDTCVADGFGLIVGGETQVTTSCLAELQVHGTLTHDAAITIGRWAVSTAGPVLDFVKSRNGTIGSTTIVVDGDTLGSIGWYADDSGDFATPAASIAAQVDGTPGADDMPGRLIFSTTADAGNTVTEAMRLSNDQSALFAGVLGINGTAVDANIALNAVYVETDPGDTAKYGAYIDLQISEVTDATPTTVSKGLVSKITVEALTDKNLSGALAGVQAEYVVEGGTTGIYTTMSAFRCAASVGSGTLAAGHGLFIENCAVAGTLTAQYGIRIADLTSGTSDYGIYIDGADTEAIHVEADPTVLQGGVYGGSATTEDLLLQPNTADTTTGYIRLGDDGILGVCIGGTHVDAWPAKNNYLWIADTTISPAANATGNSGAGIFAAAGELWSIDDLGNTTQQTSHDKAGNWVFNSVFGGTKTRINIEKFLERMIAKYPGEFDDIIEKD